MNRFPIVIAMPLLLVSVAWQPNARAQPEGPLLGESVAADSAAEYYEKALIAHNRGETRSAYIFLKNALRDDPLLLPAHLLLGKIYLSLGQGERAEKQLLIADGLGAHRSLILNSLARAYLMQGRPEQVVDELFPAGSAPEEDAELLALRGEAHLELGQYFDAQRSFTQAWERNPRSVPAILGRVQLLLRDGELEKASALMDDAVEIAPNSARAWYLKGVLAQSAGDLFGALEDFERSVEALPAYLPAQIARVSVLLRLGRVDDARDASAEVREIYPNDPRSHFIEAVIQARLGNERLAEEALLQAHNLISRIPRELVDQHLPTLMLAGMVSFNLKQWEQAGDYLDLYLSLDPTSVGARVLLARIELEQNNTPEAAIRLLQPAVEAAPDNIKALSLLAEAYMKSGQYILASRTLREALRQDQRNVVLRTQRAVSNFGLGRRNNAIEELAEVLDGRPELDTAGATLVVMQMQEHDDVGAAESARRLLLSNPGNLTYFNLLGAALLKRGELDGAEWAFDMALTLEPGFFPARQNLAELLMQREQVRLARGHLSHLLRHQPSDSDALMLLARSYEAEGNLDQAVTKAREALGVDPGSVDAAVYLTELLLSLREADEAVRVAETIEARARDPDDVALLATLSRAYIASGRRSTAQVVLRRGSSLAGYDARKLLRVAMLQREAGDMDGALWSLQKATEGEPSYLPTRMKLGEMLVSLGRFAEAIPMADALAKDWPDAPYADHLRGLIHSAQNNPTAALESFRAALSKEPSALLAIRVYEAQLEAEGLAPAVEDLAAWIAEHPRNDVADQTLAQGYYDLGRIDEARTLFEETLAHNPDNPLLLNNMAVVYAEIGDERALEYAERAYALMPSAPEIGDTLGWILVRRGELAEGLMHLRDARSRAARDSGIGYHIAVALSELGRTEEAIDELVRTLSDDSIDVADRERASRLLTALRDGKEG